MIERKYLFVGEKRSQTAIDNNWTWIDGRLAATQLFDALNICGINPFTQEFVNVFLDDGDSNMFEIPKNFIVVGMGKTVQEELEKRGISHCKIVHPAARGSIRQKDKYAEHIKEVLLKNK